MGSIFGRFKVRSAAGKLHRRLLFLAVTLGISTGLGLTAGWGMMPSQLEPTPPSIDLPSQPGPPGPGHGIQQQPRDEEKNPLTPQIEARQAKARNEERQQRMVKETAKLLQLAGELKAEVDKADTSSPPSNIAKKTAEIEKLAKDVKEKMIAD